MTQAQENGPEREIDDLLAAEYVLGVLAANERQAVARRIESDAAFARLVDNWEVQLSPIATAYPQVEPPSSVKAALDRRLFAPATAESPARRHGGFWSSLGFWRWLAAGAIAVLAMTIILPTLQTPVSVPQSKMVATLAADGSDVKYLAAYDAAEHAVDLEHVSGERASGKDFELWMIEGKNPPVSMGVIPAGATVRMPVSTLTQEKLVQGAVLAVSLEPAGGSPTGQPTGPVIAAGDLKNI